MTISKTFRILFIVIQNVLEVNISAMIHYNPIPFHVRAIGVGRFARSLEQSLAFTYRIAGIREAIVPGKIVDEGCADGPIRRPTSCWWRKRPAALSGGR